MNKIQVHGIALVEREQCRRICAKYGSDHPDLSTFHKQRELEERLVGLSMRSSGVEDNIFLESNWIVISKNFQDFSLFVLGSLHENEFLLAALAEGVAGSLLRAFHQSSPSGLNSKDVWSQIDDCYVILDEAIQGSTIFETDNRIITQRCTNISLDSILGGNGSKVVEPSGGSSSNPSAFDDAIAQTKQAIFRNLGI